MGIVYARETAAVSYDGGALVIARGAAYDDGHAIVRAHPGLFESEPSRVAGRPTVERATRAPGERSNAKAPTSAEKKAAAAAKRKATMEAKKKAAEEKKSEESATDGAG